MAVWEEVKCLLKNPDRLTEEYQCRLSETERSSLDQKNSTPDKQVAQLQRGISRLIDSYTQEYFGQEAFEPRIKAMKYHLKSIEEQKQKILDEKHLKNELTLIVTRLEQFALAVKSKLEHIDWLTKRNLIRTWVKRIEIHP